VTTAGLEPDGAERLADAFAALQQPSGGAYTG
jgi:hypothetical protein